MRFTGDSSERLRRVRVPGRSDIGEVLQQDQYFGVSKVVYCAVVHFPETGEVAFYDMSRVETAFTSREAC